jgi:hypothetical protein
MNGEEISSGYLNYENNSDIRFDYRYLSSGFYFLEVYDHQSVVYLGKLFINK